MFTGLASGDSISLNGFFTGLIDTGNFSGYVNLNRDYIIQEVGSGYFSVSGSGDNFLTGEYTGKNGYISYIDRSSYSGQLTIAKDFSLKQSPFSDPQTSYVWRVRSENLYNNSDWSYAHFYTPNQLPIPNPANIQTPNWHQSGVPELINKDGKVSVFFEWSGDDNADYYEIQYGNAYYQSQPTLELKTNYSKSFGPIKSTSGHLFLDYGTGYSFRIVSKNIAGLSTSSTGLFFIQEKPDT